MMYDDYHLYEIIVPMRLSCSSRHQIPLFHKYIVDSHPRYDVRCMMWYMGNRP